MAAKPSKKISTFPYSFSYTAEIHSPGSFPFFRTGTNAALSFEAMIGPSKNPLASRLTMTSILPFVRLGIVWEVRWFKKLAIRTSNATGSLKIGKISRKLMP